MFVSISKHKALREQYVALTVEHNKLIDRWNTLVRRINKKGGESFLDGEGTPSLTSDDIARLLMLCHPDRHGGKQMAVDMTQKLLQLRSSGK